MLNGEKMDFIEYLSDLREEERLTNLTESLIATEEERKNLEKLAKKNIKSFIYFKNVLNEHNKFTKLQDCGKGQLDYYQIGKALMEISYDTDVDKLIEEAENF